jgi:hypothetical protein
MTPLVDESIPRLRLVPKAGTRATSIDAALVRSAARTAAVPRSPSRNAAVLARLSLGVQIVLGLAALATMASLPHLR